MTSWDFELVQPPYGAVTEGPVWAGRSNQFRDLFHRDWTAVDWTMAQFHRYYPYRDQHIQFWYPYPLIMQWMEYYVPDRGIALTITHGLAKTRRAMLAARCGHDDSVQVLIDPHRDGVHDRQSIVNPAGRCAAVVGEAGPDRIECDYDWTLRDWASMSSRSKAIVLRR